MNIIMHGATNRGSSNFGDFIYAEAICNYLKSLDESNKIFLYQPSEYFLKYMSNLSHGQCKMADCDLLVYLPGGYFGEAHQTTLKINLIHFLRFMPAGLKAVLFNKKIVVFGIGAGPIKSILFKLPIKIICNHSDFISVRDGQSYEALKKLGIKTHIQAFDPILSLSIDELKRDSEQIEKIKSKAGKKKILFVHYNHSKEALIKFAKAINGFCQNNNDYMIVVGSDCILKQEEEYFKEFKQLVNYDCYHYYYDSPYEFISLLNISSLVLTCKLHAGVVACQLNKSVVCAAEHPEKTYRFYEEINYLERFLNLYKCESSDILKILEKYKNCKINIPQTSIDKSDLNYKLLKGRLDEKFK